MIVMEDYDKEKHDLADFNDFAKKDVTHVFIKDNKIIGRANMYICDSDIFIGFIEAREKNKGYGSQMIEFLKGFDRDYITGDSTDNAKNFWTKMGAVHDEPYDGAFYIKINPDAKDIEF